MGKFPFVSKNRTCCVSRPILYTLFCNCCSQLSWVYTCFFLVPSQSLESYDSINLGEQCIITALAHVGSRVDLCASLSNQNVSCENKLSVSRLNTQSLGLRVSTVLGTSHTLLG